MLQNRSARRVQLDWRAEPAVLAVQGTISGKRKGLVWERVGGGNVLGRKAAGKCRRRPQGRDCGDCAGAESWARSQRLGGWGGGGRAGVV